MLNISKNFKEKLSQACIWLLGIISVSYLLSLMARQFWLAELFSHFLMQYAVGGAILFAALLALGRWRLALIALVVSLMAFWQTLQNLQGQIKLEAGYGDITLVQYNQFLGSRDFERFESWVRDEGAGFDVIVIQEAADNTANLARRLKDEFPYQIAYINTEGMDIDIVVLSRLKILDHSTIPIKGPFRPNGIIRASLDLEGFEHPLNLYTMHATTPMKPWKAKQRNYELHTAASHIAADDSPYKVFMGDFNITPYSPYFADLLDVSELNYYTDKLLHTPTWPSFSLLPFLKIPIDHVLYSDRVRQVDKKAAYSFPSDHHALVTKISFIIGRAE